MPSAANRPGGLRDHALELAAFGLSGAALAPAAWAFFRYAISSTQLLYGLVLLAALAVGGLRRLPAGQRWGLTVTAPVFWALGAACLLPLLGALLHQPLLALAGAGAWGTALAWAVLGRAHYAAAGWFCAVGGLYAAAALHFPAFDLPLRRAAGEYAVALLRTFGLDARLYDMAGPQGHQFLIHAGGRLFHVATECNGFGLLTTCLLLGLLLAGWYRQPWPDRLMTVVLAAVAGFAGNLLRIAAIILGSLHLPLPYEVVHEAAGLLLYAAALGLVAAAARPPETKGTAGPPAAAAGPA